MSDDLTTRLRKYAETRPHIIKDPLDEAAIEAADEIETLRARLATAEADALERVKKYLEWDANQREREGDSYRAGVLRQAASEIHFIGSVKPKGQG